MTVTFMEQYGGEAEQVLSAVLDQSRDCIKLVSVTGELEFMNTNGRRAMEIPDFQLVAGKQWADLWPETSRKLIVDSLDKARRGQNSRFEALCPTYAGSESWWDVSVAPLYDGDGALSHILATSRDVTASVNLRLSEKLRREAAEREAEFSDAISREMRHRLKNQLAVVGSVAKLIARNSTSVEEMNEKFERKILALARAQDLLTIHRDFPISARDAIHQVLEASGAGDQIEVLSIPTVRMGDDAVQGLALILGELQTNSLKYGALASGEGKITLSGRIAGQSLSLHWHEDTGREITKPEATGVGMKILERLGSSTDARATTDWHRTGPAHHFYLRFLPDGPYPASDEVSDHIRQTR